MRNKKKITVKQMNQQGIVNIILGFVFWLILMFNLKVFKL